MSTTDELLQFERERTLATRLAARRKGQTMHALPDLPDYRLAQMLIEHGDPIAAAIDAVEGVPAGTGQEIVSTITDPRSSRHALAQAAGMATAALYHRGESMDEAAAMVAHLVPFH